MCLAIPMKVVSIQTEGGHPTGLVEVGGIRRSVDFSLIMSPSLKVGAYVVVHAGFAISITNEEEARLTLEIFEELTRAAAEESEALPARPAHPKKSESE